MIDLTMPGHPVLVPQTWTQGLVLNARARINQAIRRRSGSNDALRDLWRKPRRLLERFGLKFAVSLLTKFEAAITPRGATP